MKLLQPQFTIPFLIHRGAVLGASALALLVGGLGNAQAQGIAAAAASDERLDEIVVTARKREESLQTVPVAVTAQTALQLEQQGIQQLDSLARVVPSMQISSSGPSVAGGSTGVSVTLRGQAAGGTEITLSAPVGFYVDTAPVPRALGLNGSFFDIERVEVLKGPQGTLYGRNTTGGAINILTRNADFRGVHGYLSAEGGRYGDWKVGGAINVPVIDDKLAIRVAYQHWSRDGVGSSLTTGQKLGFDHDDDIGRLSLNFTPTATFSAVTKVEWQHDVRAGYPSSLVAVAPGSLAALEIGLEGGCGAPSSPTFGGCVNNLVTQQSSGLGRFQTRAGGTFGDRLTTWHVVEDINWQISDEVALRSISGYHYLDDFAKSDLDGSIYQILEVNQPLIAPFTPNPYPQEPAQRSSAYSQEFDLSGNFRDRLQWLVGAFGARDKARANLRSEIFPLLLQSEGNIGAMDPVITSTWGVYSQNDIKLVDKLSLTVGARYSAERQSATSYPSTWQPATSNFSCPLSNTFAARSFLCPPFEQSIRSHGISYLASLNWQLAPDTLIYLKTARGFRGGALQGIAVGAVAVDPETATDVELGVKSDFFDNRLRTNIAAYQTAYDNKQESVIISDNSKCGPGATNGCSILQNAASARVRGVEAEITARPIRAWSIYSNITWLQGVYLDYRNPLTPTGPLFPGLPCNPPPGTPAPDPLPSQCIAHDLPFANPKWQTSLGSRYEFDVTAGRIGAQLDYAWQSSGQLSVLNLNTSFSPEVTALQRESVKSFGILNGRIDFEMLESGIKLGLFVTNLTDVKHPTYAVLGAPLSIVRGFNNEPRMWGLQIKKSFGDD